jgi:iron complex transport system ATP-binding protein
MARTLNATAVAFGYREPVLHGVDLCLAPGECVALLGANGAGKTTLLRLLAGLERPGEGEILVGGEPAWGLTAAERSRRIGYLPQRVPEATGFAVYEIVLMGLYAQLPARGWESKREWLAVGRALRRAGALPLLRRPFDELSGGEQRRVLLARALVARPEILLLDEPLAALDPGFAVELSATLRRIRGEGVAMVLATHRLSLARELADRVVVMRDGRVIAEGRADAVMVAETLDAAYDTHYFGESDAAGGAG